MTIIAAVHKDGETWVGSDSRAVFGDTLIRTEQPKWIVRNGVCYLYAGYAFINSYLAKAPDNCFTGEEQQDIDNLITFLKEKEFSYDSDDEKKDSKAFPNFNLIYATKKLVCYVDLYGDVEYIENGQLWAMGSGQKYALGASAALNTSKKVSAKNLIKKTIQATIECTNTCGGPIHVTKL